MELLVFALSVTKGLVAGALAYLLVRTVITGFFTVEQNERAIKLAFGRAQRLRETRRARPSESVEDRYQYPQLRVIGPGGPYFKWPWERVIKVSVATQTINMAHDPESPSANKGGTALEAVTRDQLNIDLTGQLRYRVSERNLYAYLFGVKSPLAHVMGYFISILRERIANFEAPVLSSDETQQLMAAAGGVSINDLRKNLRDLNLHMDQECSESEHRYGIVLDASLITGIDPPQEVESALAAINTAHNHVSSEISLAEAAADQRIVQSKRAVEIATLDAQAEVEPLKALAEQLRLLRDAGHGALPAYLRNARLGLLARAEQVVTRSPHA